MQDSRTIWNMGDLPFHMGPLPRPDLDEFPSRMPFRVGFDASMGLFIQVYDERVKESLQHVYACGSQLGIPMGDQGLGKAYSDDFLDIIRTWAGTALSSSSILEIGCGAGHLLKALAQTGADVSGVEPDPRCRPAMERHGIPLATCELDDFHTDRRFDTIVHYCVLEHAADPVAFLLAQKEMLAPGGRIICAVPDCAEALDAGDISIFIHQHWSYFSSASLAAVAEAAGLCVDAEQRARVGGLLYVSLRDDEGGRRPTLPGVGPVRAASDAGDPIDPEAFVESGKRAVANFIAYVRGTIDNAKTLGIYCPARAINYIPPHDPVCRSPRLFDDSSLLLGKFVPPFASPVESGADLERDCVDQILIMSRSFGPAIEDRIRERRLQPEPRIRHVDEILKGG